jgi:mycothiol synthase
VASTWSVVDALSPDEHDAVVQLLADVERSSNDEALTEDHRERLDGDLGVRHALRHDDGRLTGYCVLAEAEPLEAEPALGSLDDDLVRTLEGLARPVRLLVRPASEGVLAPLADRGWRVVRGLRRLRRLLPADPPAATDLVVRPFEVGRDEAAWVAANNAAFAGHPTQSHMTVDKLVAREAEPWFDPAGFLLLVDRDELAASCWTKVHHLAEGDVGEIYVISVVPGVQRHGLGRLAVLLGLDHLAAKGIETAELFVEDDNDRARALYAALGFVEVGRVAELRFDPMG